ncbi:hypothetical protein [Sedimentitalea sp.]|uniref:hypothetical protein n=1 Tax=Sedimentitalea sp. TaxID=2048915 RepID=UPI003299B0F4
MKRIRTSFEMDLKEKTIIIPGAAQGLGAEIQKEIAQQGVNLALVDLDEGKFDETVRASSSADVGVEG